MSPAVEQELALARLSTAHDFESLEEAREAIAEFIERDNRGWAWA